MIKYDSVIGKSSIRKNSIEYCLIDEKFKQVFIQFKNSSHMTLNINQFDQDNLKSIKELQIEDVKL
tara:strand:- start:52 stop:249 length:198 start_codon:yes stop_codon:yes gene_type:complete